MKSHKEMPCANCSMRLRAGAAYQRATLARHKHRLDLYNTVAHRSANYPLHDMRHYSNGNQPTPRSPYRSKVFSIVMGTLNTFLNTFLNGLCDKRIIILFFINPILFNKFED